MHKTKKGSLAIEATISFTVFICFMFILLSMVKLSMVYITINDVTSEAVKKIAGMSYPISYVNDMIDDTVESFSVDITSEKLVNLASDGSKSPSLLEKALGNSVSFGNIQDALDIINSMKNNLIKILINNLVTFKQNEQTKFAAQVYLNLLDETLVPINKENVSIKFFSFPMSKTEFENESSKEKICELTGLNESDLNKDDVILLVEYDYRIAIPFFPAYDVKLKSLAVEKAWLKGGNHLTPSKREGIPLNLFGNKLVYYTASGKGKKYHKIDCITLSRSSSKLSCTVSAARGQGYKPCKVCKPDEDAGKSN